MPKKGKKNQFFGKKPEQQPSVLKYNYKPGCDLIDISIDKNKKILKEIIKPGTGDFFPAHGSKVFIHYTAFLSDNVVFHNTLPLKEPTSFVIGDGK